MMIDRVMAVPRFSRNFLSARRSMRFAAVLVLALCCGLAQAQFDNGSITGTLRDASGAVVAGATVTIRNVATGVTNVLTTNQDGTYQALALIPGVYSVEASAQGFGTSKNP
ncbi:MAG TPA: carboxypeptidase-like regulatory domain-containing protein, partial [Edaphobacter sp.]